MRANVNVSSLVVRYGEASWPFSLDLDKGSASIELHDCEYEVGPLSWPAKMRLARFAHMEPEFVQARFLETCLRTPKVPPNATEDKAVLVALATWINLPSGEQSGLPLDQNQLASVTVEVCRALGVGPTAFAELSAVEVEMLWQTLDRETFPDETPDKRARTRSTRPLPQAQASEPQFDTKIVIVPDQTQFQAEPESANETILPVADAEPVQRAGDDVLRLAADEKAADQKTFNETKLSARKVVRPEHKTTARFRFSIDEPVVKGSPRNVPAFRLPLTQPDRNTRSPRVGPTNLALAPVIEVERSEEPTTKLNLLADLQITAASPSEFPQPTAITPATSRRSFEVEERQATEPASRDQEMEWMLDAFCERLAEAAADLGILEEV